jgi:DeoR/GlpR family transcriptional regulator of sugar metabolism
LPSLSFETKLIITMSKRNTPQRRHNILTLLNEQGEVSVDELAKRFETSEVTIRKDLAALESNGLLLRRYGGAITMPQELVGDPAQPVSAYKRAIARAAVMRLREHARIIIDSGSTTAAMIPELGHQPGLVVMTNSLHVASALSELEHEPVLLMTGGTWDPHSDSFQGQVAEQVLRSYDFDQLFIGADGIDLQRGTTTFNELLGLSRVMAEVAREVVPYADMRGNHLGEAPCVELLAQSPNVTLLPSCSKASSAWNTAATTAQVWPSSPMPASLSACAAQVRSASWSRRWPASRW